MTSAIAIGVCVSSIIQKKCFSNTRTIFVCSFGDLITVREVDTDENRTTGLSCLLSRFRNINWEVAIKSKQYTKAEMDGSDQERKNRTCKL